MNRSVGNTGIGSYFPQEIATPADLIDSTRILLTRIASGIGMRHDLLQYVFLSNGLLGKYADQRVPARATGFTAAVRYTMKTRRNRSVNCND